MLAAEATACRPSTGTSYSSIIVSSAGGVGTTSLFHALGQVVPIINDENDEDKLKHATARQLQARGLPLRYGAAPLLLFVYDDPVRQMLSLARRGWQNFQAFKLGKPVTTAQNEATKPFIHNRCVVQARHASVRAAAAPRGRRRG